MTEHQLLTGIEGNVYSASCSCGKWWQEEYLGPYSLIPNYRTAHHVHVHFATPPTATERPMTTDTLEAPAAELAATAGIDPLNALVAIANAIAEMAKESVKALEAMQEFVDAHAKAKDAGHGVLVVRRADGTVTTTPNVFLPAGTAIFTDALSMSLPPAPDLKLTRGTYAVGGYVPPEYLPRYTIATGETVTLPAAPRPILVTDAA